jgi:hypothetical protein
MSTDGDSPNEGGGGSRRAFGRNKIKDEPSERIGGGNYEGPVDDNFNKFLRNLIKERDSLDAEQFPSIHRLVQAGMVDIVVLNW